MHKLPIIPYNLRKRSTKQKPSKLKPMTTPTSSTSNLQDAIIPTTNSLPSPTSTSQNIQLSPPISTSPSVNPPNSPTTNFSLTHPEPTVALSSSPQNLCTALPTVENLLASEDQYENEFLQHPPIETYAPTTSTCNEPIISLNQPTRSPPIPITTNAEQNLSGLETWARNLPSPQTFPQLNQAQTFPNAHYASRQPPQSNSPWLNQQPAPFTHSANVSLPPFWESNVELWFTTAEHAFTANGIFNEHKRFSLVLGALDIKMIQTIQHVVRSPTSYPYQDIKKALIKACKLNENDRLDILFYRTELGDRKPSEMLSEMRQLLEAYDADNAQTNAVLKKLFLDKLPQPARTILAANLETNLDVLALRADEVVAALSQISNQTDAQQQLINEIFDQKLNKIIETLQAPNTTTQHTPRQPGGYRTNYYNSRPPSYNRFNDAPRQMYRPRFNTYNQNINFQQQKNFRIRPRGSAASNRK